MKPTETTSWRMSRLSKEEQGYQERQELTRGEENEQNGPSQLAQLAGATSHTPNGCGLNPLVMMHAYGSCATDWCFSLSLLLLPLSLKISKYILKWGLEKKGKKEKEQKVMGTTGPHPAMLLLIKVYGVQGRQPPGAPKSSSPESASNTVSPAQRLCWEQNAPPVCAVGEAFAGCVLHLQYPAGCMYTSSSSRYGSLGLGRKEGYVRGLFFFNCWQQTK